MSDFVTDEMVEAAARALCQEDESDGGPPWDALPMLFPRLRRQDSYRASARAALTAAAPTASTEAIVDLVRAAGAYLVAVETMQDAVHDGVNVQGAISGMIGAGDNLRAALSRFKVEIPDAE